jgi:predicted 3-demethylubiquinone-9 3-methyltransferase (glyoxalase superfamily)
LNRRQVVSAGIAGANAIAIGCIAFAEESGERVNAPMASLTPLLTFAGDAETAIRYYTGALENSKVISIDRYGPEGPGKEGTVRIASIELCGQRMFVIDSPVQHEWTFTPAISLHVECSEESVERYYEVLSKDGTVHMPLDRYPFSKKFAWVQDRFGVSWQLSAT